MQRSRLKIATLVFAASAVAAASAQKILMTGYVNDPVGRNVVHIESRAPLETMSIFTNKITGEIHGDPQNFLDNPQARFEVDMSSLDTGIALRNEHLRSNMWLDTAKYPKAVFTLTKLYEPGTRYNGLVANGLSPLQPSFSRTKVASLKSGKTYTSVAQGTMEMHGVTKTIYANIEWTPRKGSDQTKNRLPGDLMHIRATFPLRLSDFGINVPAMAQLEVANVQDVTVDFFASTEPTKAPEAKLEVKPAVAPKPMDAVLSNLTLVPHSLGGSMEPLSTLSELPAAEQLSQIKLNPFPGYNSDKFGEKQFIALWRTAKLVAPDDKSYAVWSSGSFQTPKGRYIFVLYLGGRGVLTTPDGKRGMFQWEPSRLEVAPKPDVATLHNETVFFSALARNLRPLSTLSELPAADELSQVKLERSGLGSSPIPDAKQFVALWRTAKLVAANDKLLRDSRVARELKLQPERLALYDDIAVAYDRLGRDDEAIGWMNRKKAQLAKSSTRSPAKHQALYRYYANNGTFWAHRWLRAGANRARLNEMKTARNLVAQAIKIKPDAHFGREKYQLMTMDWIINPRAKADDGKMYALTLAEYIREKQRDGEPSPTTGLSGLIVLGNAWESLDIFHALGDSLAYEKATVQYLAILRCRELIAEGKKSLRPDSKSGGALEKQLWIDAAFLNSPSALPVNAQNQAAIETVYKRLRTEAEAWQARRTSYMMARLQSGKHPDTDATFWRDWHDTKPPSLDVAWYSEREAKSRKGRTLSSVFGAFIPLFAVVCGTLIFLRRKRLRSQDI